MQRVMNETVDRYKIDWLWGLMTTTFTLFHKRDKC